MIILPDRNIPRSKFLLPMRRRMWHDLTIRFRLTGRLNDGHIAWRGYFLDREDADAFLFAVCTDNLIYERQLWDLPSPSWRPDFRDLIYQFETVTLLSGGAGSNQTFTSPVDWNNAGNTIECLGAGGSGGANSAGAAAGGSSGGGGGAYSFISDFTFASPGTTTATYQCGAGGPTNAVTGSLANGTAGGATWFNSATNPGSGADNSKCSADGGNAGQSVSVGTATSAAGGGGGASWGTVKHAGGASGSADTQGASGGGGASGLNGAGVASSNGIASPTDGGNGDASHGGAGGAAATVGPAATGGNGNEWPIISAGSGGGGGAFAGSTAGNADAGAGGNYGAGGGGSFFTLTTVARGGAGTQGIIVLVNSPFTIIPDVMSDYINRKIRMVRY